jgi:hypothetical protein
VKYGGPSWDTSVFSASSDPEIDIKQGVSKELTDSKVKNPKPVLKPAIGKDEKPTTVITDKRYKGADEKGFN